MCRLFWGSVYLYRLITEPVWLLYPLIYSWKLFGPVGDLYCFSNTSTFRIVSLQFSGVRECQPWYSIVGATVTMHQFFCILYFCHTCSLCRVELVVRFAARGSTQVLLWLLPGVFWLWHFLYSVGPHPVSSLHIYTFVVSWAFTAGAARQAGDADSSRAPGLTSGFQRSVNVHRGTLLLVPQCQCISSFVFYICRTARVFDILLYKWLTDNYWIISFTEKKGKISDTVTWHNTLYINRITTTSKWCHQNVRLLDDCGPINDGPLEWLP